MYVNQQTDSPTFATLSSEATRVYYTVNTSVQNAAGVIDWDGDGMYDLLIGGTKKRGQQTEGYLYLNEKSERAGRLSMFSTFPGAASPCFIFPDWNGDGRKDCLVNGLFNDDIYLTNSQNGTARVLCYNLYPTPSRPDAPLNPTADVQDSEAVLQWETPETAQPCFTYEVFIKDEEGKLLNSTPAFVGGENDGKRKVNRMGRVGNICKWTFRPVKPGTYTWGVQTIDATYTGSPFTEGPAFTVSDPTGIQSPSADAETSGATTEYYYSPEGIRYVAARRGLNIVRKNQSLRKVMVP